MKVAVTGANGFIGASLVSYLENAGHDVVPCVRFTAGTKTCVKYTTPPVQVGDINGSTNWESVLDGVDIVVHSAARVHVMHDRSNNPSNEFRQINTYGTANLARHAATKGVQRLVFISSAKVHGEATTAGQPFTSDDPPNPTDLYSRSKLEAEDFLKNLTKATDMDLVIVRPPLVYGPGVKANFSSMIKWLKSGLPLPLSKATVNRRSLIGLDNLVDFLALCTDRQRVRASTFLVSDDEDLSTAELLIRLAGAMNVKPHLMPIPLWLLEYSAAAVGKRAISQRLLGNFQLDISNTKEQTGWRPPFTVEEGLKRAVQVGET